MNMKQLTLSILAVVGFSSLAGAQMFIPTFQQVCQLDSECGKVGSMSHGQFLPHLPPAELINYYKNLRPTIIQIARLYKIDPVTLAATPLAENTMNVHIKGKKLTDILSYAAWKGTIEDKIDGSAEQVDDNGYLVNPVYRQLINRPLSVGPGQIYVSAAKSVEKFAAQIEGREIRKKGGDIKNALYTSDGALKYAAAILRTAQDQYAAAGYDISRRPEVLATVYNVGRLKMIIERTKFEHREPLPNYFGSWVAMNYWYIQNELQLPSILTRP